VTCVKGRDWPAGHASHPCKPLATQPGKVLRGRDWVKPPALKDMFADLNEAKAACPRPLTSQRLGNMVANTVSAPYTVVPRLESTSPPNHDTIDEDGLGSSSYRREIMQPDDGSHDNWSVTSTGSIPPMALAFAGLPYGANASEYVCTFARSWATYSPATRVIVFTNSLELAIAWSPKQYRGHGNVRVLLVTSAPPANTDGWMAWRYWYVAHHAPCPTRPSFCASGCA
jgi:hypothetical protein